MLSKFFKRRSPEKASPAPADRPTKPAHVHPAPAAIRRPTPEPEDAAATAEAMGSFADLGLDEAITRAAAATGYTAPTPIQARSVRLF